MTRTCKPTGPTGGGRGGALFKATMTMAGEGGGGARPLPYIYIYYTYIYIYSNKGDLWQGEVAKLKCSKRLPAKMELAGQPIPGPTLLTSLAEYFSDLKDR